MESTSSDPSGFPGDTGAVDEGLLERARLLGRIVRALRELSGEGIVVDLAEEGDPEAPPGRLTFHGRVPGLTVAAAALSDLTGWRPVPADPARAVDLLDAARQRRLRIQAGEAMLAVELTDLPGAGPIPAFSMQPASSPAPGVSPTATGPVGDARDVLTWLQGLRARCEEVLSSDGAEVLKLPRTGGRCLRVALHTRGDAG